MVCAWPAFGIPETHTVLDGAAVTAAGARSQVLWPQQAEPDEVDERRKPIAPATGWFAEAIRRGHKNG